MMTSYYFKIEKPIGNVMTFAYIWRDGDDFESSPPVKEFHSMADNAYRVVAKKAIKWIKNHGSLAQLAV